MGIRKKRPNPDGYQPKFPQDIPQADAEKLVTLIEALHDNDNVQNVYTNAASLPAVDEETTLT